QFTGGEPLLRLDLMEAVARFGRESGRKLILAVQTNGTLLTPEACRWLKAIRCGVGVSLDGVGAANGLRVFPDGTAGFDAAAQGIRNLGQCGLRCGLTAVVTKTNAACLGQLADLALYLGNVAGVGLDLFRPLGRGAEQDLSPTAEELELGLKALKRRTEEFQAAKVPFRLRELERLRRRQSISSCGEVYCCAQTSLSLAVDGRGDCWPCSSLAGQSKFLLGNLREGLPERNHRADALAAPAGCRSCDHFSRCQGGCPAGRAAGKGPDRLTCVMHRVLAEENE
ncbi:MAG: radical SAM protein, partial [Oscillospiraceae bacterium]